MPDSDLPDTCCLGKWPKPLRLALDSTVTVLMNAYMMARGRAAGSPSKIVLVIAERDEALWKLRLVERELEAQRRRIAEIAPAKRPSFLREDSVVASSAAVVGAQKDAQFLDS